MSETEARKREIVRQYRKEKAKQIAGISLMALGFLLFIINRNVNMAMPPLWYFALATALVVAGVVISRLSKPY